MATVHSLWGFYIKDEPRKSMIGTGTVGDGYVHAIPGCDGVTERGAVTLLSEDLLLFIMQFPRQVAQRVADDVSLHKKIDSFRHLVGREVFVVRGFLIGIVITQDDYFGGIILKLVFFCHFRKRRGSAIRDQSVVSSRSRRHHF